jgi:flagellar hook protein FlgE
MFSGVSGLRAHQLRMDVIGNNIANVNTVGFKASSVQFAEIYSQTLQGAGAPTQDRGGTNPQQVGLGVNTNSVSVNHQKGSTQRTDNTTDLMIDGNGFFIVSADAAGQNRFYTRAGNFSLDRDGFLVTASGMKVLDKDFKPVQINQSDTVKATATQSIVLNGNLGYNTESYTTTADVYDSLGRVNTLTVEFPSAPIANGNEGSYREMRIYDEDGTLVFGNAEDPDSAGDPLNTGTRPERVFVEFDENGEFVGIFTSDIDVDDPVDEVGDLGTLTTIGAGSSLILESPGADDISLYVDERMFFQNADVEGDVRVFTQFDQTTDVKGTIVEGNSAGTIESFTIAQNGEVIGIFTNGERDVIGTIGIADFDNPPGLLKTGNNLFSETPNSGVPKYGQPSTGSFGSLTPGALEMSNVDLAAEFTNMITTQRGFQANSRIITTSDEILQELVNLKR